MIQLGQVSLAGTAIVLGGVGLGWALSGFVEPIPTQAPEPAWRTMFATPIAAGSQAETRAAYYGGWPQDLSPPDPTPQVAAAEAEWLAEARRNADAQLMDADYATPVEATDDAAPADREVAIPHYRALEEAAGARPEGESDEAPVDPGVEPAILAVPIDPATPPLPAVRAHTIRIGGAES